MPPPLTPQDEEEERRRLLESVDYAALDGLAGATSPVTQQAPPASRDDGVIRPFAEPISIGPSAPAQSAPAEPAVRPAAPAAPIDPRSSTAPGRRGPWPDAPGSRRVGNTVAYAPGTLPMPPRAQAIEERLRNGEADDVAVETTAAIDAAPPIPPQETPVSPLAPRSTPATDEPEPEPPDPDVEERAMAALAGEDMSAQPPVELASLRPRAAALGSPMATPMDESEDAVEKPEAAMKEGPQGLIPGDAEIASARDGDIPRRLLHNLANAFRAMGGRPANREFVRDEDRVRAQQRQMLGDKRTALGDERRLNEQAMTRALQQRQLEQREQQASERADIQRAQLDLAGRTADRQDQMSQAQMSRLLEQTESERAERENAAAMRTPSSDVSGRRRTVMEGLVASLPPGDRARVTEALGHSADGRTLAIDQLSAEDLDALRRDMTRFLGNGLRAPRGGVRGGGGGGAARSGAPTSVWGTDRDPLVQAAIEAGTDPRVARVQASDARSRRTLAATLSRTGVGQERADELQEQHTRIPGFTRTADARRLTARESQEASRVATADREFRAAVSQLETDLGGLSASERAAGVYGLGEERYARIGHSLDVIRNQLRQINNAGNSLGAQEMAEHAIPGLTERTTAAAILANVRAAQSVKHLYVTSLLGQLGYEPEAGGGGHGGGHGGGARTPRADRAPAATDTRVMMIFPDGRRGRVPESQVQAAIDSRGARRAE